MFFFSYPSLKTARNNLPNGIHDLPNYDFFGETVVLINFKPFFVLARTEADECDLHDVVATGDRPQLSLRRMTPPL